MQVLIDLDEETLRRLETVAPARSRKRAAFIRAAIHASLMQVEENRTRRAYLAEPDSEPVTFVPQSWEPLAYGGFDPPKALVKRRARRKTAK